MHHDRGKVRFCGQISFDGLMPGNSITLVQPVEDCGEELK